MAFVNHAKRSITFKLVYDGPGLSGKTTHMQYLYNHAERSTKGEFISIATEADRTLFFDFFPLTIGEVRGYRVNFHLYAVPGQVFYRSTRAMLLRGVDAVVQVMDAQPERMEANIEAIRNYWHLLEELGIEAESVPMVYSFNKLDLPGAYTALEMASILNEEGRYPAFPTVAPVGDGVIECFRSIAQAALRDFVRRNGELLVSANLKVEKTAAVSPPATETTGILVAFDGPSTLFKGEWNPVRFRVQVQGERLSPVVVSFFADADYELQSLQLENTFLVPEAVAERSGVVWVRPRDNERIQLEYRIGNVARAHPIPVTGDQFAVPGGIGETLIAVTMFVDIELGSGELSNRRIADMLAANLRLLVITAIGGAGKVYESLGESFMVIFPSASVAIVSARKLMTLVMERGAIHGDLHFGIKAGLDIRELPLRAWEEKWGGLFGTKITDAWRLCAEARSGEIIASRTLIEVLGEGVHQLVESVTPVTLTLPGEGERAAYRIT
jgi:mutual gliding-motility protein MglA